MVRPTSRSSSGCERGDRRDRRRALVEVAAIERVKHRYLRLLDTKAFDEIGGCFTADATAAFSDGRHQLTSRAEIVAFFERLLGSPQVLTNHRAHHPEIDLTGPATAVGVWAVDDEVIALDRDVTCAARRSTRTPTPRSTACG